MFPLWPLGRFLCLFQAFRVITSEQRFHLGNKELILVLLEWVVQLAVVAFYSTGFPRYVHWFFLFWSSFPLQAITVTIAFWLGISIGLLIPFWVVVQVHVPELSVL